MFISYFIGLISSKKMSKVGGLEKKIKGGVGGGGGAKGGSGVYRKGLKSSTLYEVI